MLHNTDSAGGIAATSTPGLLYIAWVYLVDLPVEKWASGLTVAFVLMQMFFLLRDKTRKHRGKRDFE